MNTDILTFILGATASLLFIASSYVLSRNLTIILQSAAIAILAFQFGFVTSVYSVAVLNVLVLIRNAFFYPDKWADKRNLFGLVSLVVLLGAAFTLQIIPDIQAGKFSIISVLPITALVFTTFAVMSKKLLSLKILFMLGSLSWVCFDLILGLYGNLIGDGFSTIAGIIAISRIFWLTRKSSTYTV